MLKRKGFGWLLGLFLLGSPLLAEYTILHSFAGATADGSNPRCNLLLVGTTLYGTTFGGGSGDGTLFKVGTDGNGYQVLHNFWHDDTQVCNPQGTLRLVGSTLYGTAISGEGFGEVYRIDTDGNNFAMIHSFEGGATDGYYPNESPIVVGSALYGTTEQGGTYNKGIVYKMDLDGGNFTILNSFGGSPDGAWPESGLVLIGATLYGTTRGGGIASEGGNGTVFKIGTNGGGYQVLHRFEQGTGDGYRPDNGTLVVDGSTLYGMTNYGGSQDYGTIYSISADGSVYAIIHDFTFSLNDGAWPHGGLILLDSKLWGLTYAGGQYGPGTLFYCGLDGGVGVIHDFGNTGDGSGPLFSLIYDSGYFYGVTAAGGTSDCGTVFKCAPPLTDLAIALTPSTYSPVPGSDVGFLMTATNNGPLSAKGIQVRDILPAGLKYKSSSGDGWYDTDARLWYVNYLDPLASGATATFTLTATVQASGAISNTAELYGMSCLDSNGANDSATAALNTIPQKQLLPPLLLSPESGNTGLPSTVTMKWADTNGNPQEVKHKLRLKKQGGSYVNTTLAQNTSQFVKSGLAAGKTYYWNVQAVGNGTTTKTSAWANGGVDFSFTVAPPATLNPPDLVSPANNAAGQPLSVTLQWNDNNSSPDELQYKVRFKIAGGAYAVTTLGPGVTQLLKTGLKAGKTYYWSVMAVGNGTTIKSSAWPADFKFTT